MIWNESREFPEEAQRIGTLHSYRKLYLVRFIDKALYASTSSLVTLRLVVMALARSWNISLANISTFSTAFLHALTEEPVFIWPPVECYPLFVEIEPCDECEGNVAIKPRNIMVEMNRYNRDRLHVWICKSLMGRRFLQYHGSSHLEVWN